MVIIDTSVVFKWFDESEPLRPQAKVLLDNHLSGLNKIFIPDLLLYEAANAWSTKTKLTTGEITDNLAGLEKYALNITAVNFGLLRKAAAFSKKYHVSVYDATYAVLAKEKKSRLITADNKFVSQVSLPFVKSLAGYS